MRYLHPVTVHEQYVASGTFSLRTDDSAEAVVVEQWSIHQQPDGAQFVRVDREDRKQGAVWLAEGWRSPAGDGGRLERYDVLAYRTGQQPVVRNRASYSLFPDLLEAGRTIGDALRDYVELTHTDYVFDPGAYALLGEVAAVVVGADGQPVIGICDDMRSPDVLLPRTIAMSAAVVGEKTFTLAGRDHPARIIELRVEGDTEVHRLWVDAHDMVLHGEVHREGQAAAHITLTDYGRRAF